MNIKRWFYQLITPMCVQKGDAYREDQARQRKPFVWDRPSIPRPTQTIEERDSIMKHARWWERWSGSRFEREENPIFAMDHREFMRSTWSKPGENRKPDIKDIVIRSNPVTGDWEKL